MVSWRWYKFVFATDAKMIQIIFENIVSNAIKYTPHGGEIQIKIQKKGNEILIGVVDTGIGIPADQQLKIFTKFFRADNASSYKADDSGLGLYIVKTVVEKIGGKIWFRSPAFVPPSLKATEGRVKTWRASHLSQTKMAPPFMSLFDLHETRCLI